jgi:hypothetical protein
MFIPDTDFFPKVPKVPLKSVAGGCTRLVRHLNPLRTYHGGFFRQCKLLRIYQGVNFYTNEMVYIALSTSWLVKI